MLFSSLNNTARMIGMGNSKTMRSAEMISVFKMAFIASGVMKIL